eukprot:scaffold3582_cov66-Phaeocystis_antarctica.AAC.5
MMQVVAAILLVASTVEESMYRNKVDDSNEERDHRAEQNEGPDESRWHARAWQIETEHADEARKRDESGSCKAGVVEACGADVETLCCFRPKSGVGPARVAPIRKSVPNARIVSGGSIPHASVLSPPPASNQGWRRVSETQRAVRIGGEVVGLATAASARDRGPCEVRRRLVEGREVLWPSLLQHPIVHRLGLVGDAPPPLVLIPVTGVDREAELLAARPRRRQRAPAFRRPRGAIDQGPRGEAVACTRVPLLAIVRTTVTERGSALGKSPAQQCVSQQLGLADIIARPVTDPDRDLTSCIEAVEAKLLRDRRDRPMVPSTAIRIALSPKRQRSSKVVRVIRDQRPGGVAAARGAGDIATLRVESCQPSRRADLFHNCDEHVRSEPVVAAEGLWTHDCHALQRGAAVHVLQRTMEPQPCLVELLLPGAFAMTMQEHEQWPASRGCRHTVRHLKQIVQTVAIDRPPHAAHAGRVEVRFEGAGISERWQEQH